VAPCGGIRRPARSRRVVGRRVATLSRLSMSGGHESSTASASCELAERGDRRARNVPRAPAARGGRRRRVLHRRFPAAARRWSRGGTAGGFQATHRRSHSGAGSWRRTGEVRRRARAGSEKRAMAARCGGSPGIRRGRAGGGQRRRAGRGRWRAHRRIDVGA